MKRFNLLLVLFCFVLSTQAQKYKNTETTVVTKEWKGSIFSSDKTLSENIENTASLSLMNSAIQKVSIKSAMDNEEMVTVFVITNEGFAQKQEKDSIFKTSNEPKLKALISYHTIPGRLDSHSIKKSIEKSNGVSYYTTLEGENIGFKEQNGQLYLVDNQGNTSLIIATDFYHKNGFFHIVEGMVSPASAQ